MPAKSENSQASVANDASGRDEPLATGLDAIDLLEADHRLVEELFDRYDHADMGEKRGIAEAICAALKIHAQIEEEIFYPAAAEATGALDLLAEAQVEHAAARDLIAQIELGHPGEPLFDAKVRVLGEYVDHHVIEEEDELFPLCREAGLDLVALGLALQQRRHQLMVGLAVSNPILALS